MNDRCCEIVGLPLEQALGIGWTVAIHPEDRGQVWRAWLQAQAENRPFQREYRFLKPDGQVVWVYGQAVPERDSNGEICGYVGSVTDISDRKRAEERLKKQEGRLRLAIQSAGMICWEYNSKTQEVKYWGRFTALGWQPDSTVSDRLSAPAEHLENYSYLLKPITPNQLINVLGQTSPLAAPPLKPLKPGAIVSPGPDWSTLRLLVVEDSPINQSVIQGFLGALDLKVDCVASGKAALEILQQTTQSPYALILMDCQMPEMDGYETTQYIRQGQAGDPYTQVPIIALTAHAMPGDREKCLAAGMNDYLTKPLTLRDLRSMLRQWLNQPPSADRFPLPQPQSLDQPSDLESIVPSSLESAGSDPPVPMSVSISLAVPESLPGSIPLFDVEGLLDRTEGQQDLAAMMCQRFLEGIPQTLAELRAIVSPQAAADHLEPSEATPLEIDWAEIERYAHRLKGSASLIGAEAFRDQAAQMENQAKQKDPDLLPTLQVMSTTLTDLFEKTQGEIDRWLS